jgi:hypothetical protein
MDELVFEDGLRLEFVRLEENLGRPAHRRTGLLKAASRSAHEP